MINIGDIEPGGEQDLVEGQKYSFIMEDDLQIISGELVGLSRDMARIRFAGCINIVALPLNAIRAFRLV